MNSGGALDGIRVIELANYVSGPYAGMMLADFGAEVIKIEMPGTGDPFRGWGAVDYSPTFGSVNRSKKSVVLDLKSADGQAAAKSLIAGADVVVENFRPGTLERLGLGFEHCRANNPRLIWCSITGFGNFGPLADRAGLRHGRAGDGRAAQRAHRHGRAQADGHLVRRPSRWHGRLQRHPRRAAGAPSHRQGPARRYFAPGSDRVVYRRERGALFRERRGARPRHPYPHRAGVCLRRRRRQAVRDPSVVAGEILEGARPRRRPSGMAGGCALQPAQGAGRRTTTCCMAFCARSSPPGTASTGCAG